MSEEDFLALMDGSLDGQSAFLGGQLKVRYTDTVVTLLLRFCYTVVTLLLHS
jgi:putative sterol carrier protein